MSELKNRIEAILFASGKGVSESDLGDYTDSKKRAITKALEELKYDYKNKDSSLTITNVEDKWKLTVKGKYTLDIQKIVSETELPKPILKTLAIVAYKSPVLQSDIINMRGQGAYEHIKILAKQKLLTKEEEGRSYILKITDKFYNYFDVEGDEDIREMFKKLREIHQEKLGQLEVVDAKIDPELNKDSQTIGSLEVVDANPVTAQRTPEELKEEEDFLKRMDANLSEVSQRIETHSFPERHTHPELEKEQKTIDDTTTSIQDVKDAMKLEKTREEAKQDKTDALKELEKFAEEKDEDEENFI